MPRIMKRFDALSYARLREVLSYDPETGIFVWLIRSGESEWNGKNAGNVAGSVNGHGYVQIKIDGFRYLAHRLAWFYTTGIRPNHFIDHADGVRTNNRIANLRKADDFQNSANSCVRRDNRTGYKGVSYSAANGKYRSAITSNGKRYYLGSFPTAQKAHDAYKAAAIKLHGEFARLK